MRVKRKPMTPTTFSNRPAPGPMFNNSLLACYARIKSQRPAPPPELPPKTSQLSVRA